MIAIFGPLVAISYIILFVIYALESKRNLVISIVLTYILIYLIFFKIYGSENLIVILIASSVTAYLAYEVGKILIGVKVYVLSWFESNKDDDRDLMVKTFEKDYDTRIFFDKLKKDHSDLGKVCKTPDAASLAI